MKHLLEEPRKLIEKFGGQFFASYHSNEKSVKIQDSYSPSLINVIEFVETSYLCINSSVKLS